MSEIGNAIHEKCLAFSDRIIKLNDYLLKQAANTKPRYTIVKGKRVYDTMKGPMWHHQGTIDRDDYHPATQTQ